jgi:hypothetical protein
MTRTRTEDNLTRSLAFEFYGVSMDSEWIDKENRISYYFIGTVLDWKFYQFNVGNLFYMGFSRKPCYMANVDTR